MLQVENPRNIRAIKYTPHKPKHIMTIRKEIKGDSIIFDLLRSANQKIIQIIGITKNTRITLI